MKERDNTFDILRALAIVFMVIGHSGSPFTDIIYLFHMPAFFILSGLLYNPSIDTYYKFKDKFVLRLKRLYIPYVSFNIVYILLNNVFVSSGLYLSDIDVIPVELHRLFGGEQHSMGFVETVICILKTLCFMGGSQMGGALWFLRAMFFSIVLFDLEHFVFKCCKNKERLILVINIILFTFGAFLSHKQIKLSANFDTVLIVMIFYSIGELSKSVLAKFKSIPYPWHVIIDLTIIALLVVASHTNKTNIGLNEYSSWYMLLMCSISGFIMLMSFSVLLSRFQHANIIGYIGKHTIMILGLHFMLFKFVSLVVVKVEGLPDYYLATYPTMGKYWLIYSVVGVSVPLIVTNLTRNNKFLNTW